MIQVKEVTKNFGSTLALDGVSLEISEGELFGIVGPNGAGKTTLLRCLVGLLQPRQGNITVGGFDRKRETLEIKRFSAFLPAQPYIYPNFTARKWMKMMADIYQIPPDARDERMERLLRIFDLSDVADKKVSYYSNGQYKKTAICGVLVTGVRLYFMDEPFTGGIDPSAYLVLKELLHGFAKDAETTVVFATQNLEEAEQLCHRMAIFDHGRFIAVGTLAELQQRAEVSEPALAQIYAKLVGRDFAAVAREFLEDR